MGILDTHPRRALAAAGLLGSAGLTGCLGVRGEPAGGVGAREGARGTPPRATVGEPFAWDAARGGRGGRYAVTLRPAESGLRVEGSRVLGTPAAPGVVTATVVAADRWGRERRDSVAIVVFAPGLPAPVLPAAPHAYADSANPALARLLARGPGFGGRGGGRGFGGPGFGGRGFGGAVGAQLDNTPPDNPITDAGATLGRVLFYDPRLSANDRVACASCHVQQFAFSDTARLSRGFAGGLTRRHSMGLANARFYRSGRFFWDERAATLEAQVLTPVQDPVEMGMALPALVAKLSATEYYPSLFAAAFGTPEVTSDRVARALAQFVRALVSADSRADGGPAAAGGLTPQEREGLRLFDGAAGCARCHAPNALASDGAHNTGLDAATTDGGAGRGRFKSPSLRNVAVRPPYMHDGRFATLEQVVEHYDAGVQSTPDLDPRLRGPDGTPRTLELTAPQKAALVAYLRALTDSAFLASPRFADPFPPGARQR
jgi:cytochrome c peroxidase